MTLNPHELTVPSSLINKHHFQATRMYWVGSPWVWEGPEIALTFLFLIYLVGLWGMSNPLVCQYHQQRHHMKSWCGEGGRRWGRLSWEDGISIWHRRGSSDLCKAEMSKSATEKDLSHQNCDIDKALLHTMGATSNASVRITGQDIFWFFFLSLS